MARDDDRDLKQYQDKRDFSHTIEPSVGESGAAFPNLRFVVQKHSARRLHYDFRLEFNGALLSWAVPSGPSHDPRDKRLAVQVEDHPLEYATFEGVIGHGNYGSGEVIVWDFGIYSPDDGGQLSFGDSQEAQRRVNDGLLKGKLSFTLRGHKMKGSWTLVRTTRNPKEWLFIKHQDEYAVEGGISEDQISVQSGLTLVDLQGGRLPSGPAALAIADMGRDAEAPGVIRPMLASPAEKEFDALNWLFEPKLDGYRLIAQRSAGRVKLVSRNNNDMTAALPRIVQALESQPESDFILDGELVALGENGLPNFGLLQRYFSDTGQIASNSSQIPLVFYPFDILFFNGRDVTGVPLMQRKQLLELVMVPNEVIILVQYVIRGGKDFFRAAVELGLEGMIAKRQDSTYRPNSRSKFWLKWKANKTNEFVVGGYTKGQGARATNFGALLLGYYEENVLKFAGRVGTGFDDKMLEKLSTKLEHLTVAKSPFGDSKTITDSKISWVDPKLVVQVKFAEWTSDGRLRAPVFLAIREDVDAPSIRIEDVTWSNIEQPSEEFDSIGQQVAQVVEQLDSAKDRIVVQVGEFHVSFTNLGKELWPATKRASAVTKRELIGYYTRMAPYLLPHLKDRPITLTRYPNGIHGKSFYQKHYDQGLPEFVDTVSLFSSQNEGNRTYIQVNNLASLLWLSQLGNLELHPWNSRTVIEPDALGKGTLFQDSKERMEASVLNFPDFIIFDLDPYLYSGKERAGDEPELNKKAFSMGVEVALSLKEILDQLSLSSYVKTSGKTGLHIFVPIIRQYDFAAVREVCQLIGKFLMQQSSNIITMEWSSIKRTGKIFVDHNQNARGKNMASIYSLRPQVGAPVSTPVRWDELTSIYPTDFNINNVPQRATMIGDLWEDILESKHDIGKVLGL